MKQVIRMLVATGIAAVVAIIPATSMAQTLSAITISPHGTAIQAGSTQKFTAACSYTNHAADDCTAAGGVTWSTGSLNALSVDGTGLATWAASADPGAGGAPAYYVVAAAGNNTTGIVKDKALVYGQHPGDTWYEYPTPTGLLFDTQTGAALPMNVVVGSTVTMGAGLEINSPTIAATAQPFQGSCDWRSSNTSIATVDSFGEITAVAPGTVNITCGEVGNAVFGASTKTGWVAPGNVLTFNVVAGGTGNTTWYVRPDGGTLYNGSTGQCDGKTNAAYPGTGTDQPCAVANLRYLWSDEVTSNKLQWVIAGGDTVIVAQNSNGYNIGQDNSSATVSPVNCTGGINVGGGGGCYMPTVPSGSATQHTQILGANHASCHDDSAKTQLVPSFGSGTAINVTDSQFVDVACFEILGKGACGGNYDTPCTDASNAGANGIMESALTSDTTYTDIFIHGLTHDGIYGPTGVGVVADYVHIRAVPSGGIDMDDTTWGSGNISVAGGFTMTNSIIEWTGCLEEYPIVHKYPVIECRDQNTGAYGDGFSTASTTGDWLFDHNTFQYNFQDGLDLLHSGMQKFTLTNNFSQANEGQQYKIGSGDTILTRNNIAEGNCYRLGALIGDEPASALAPGGFDGTFASGYGLCRAHATMSQHFDGIGTAAVQNNTILTTSGGDTPFTISCDGGWDYCPNANNIFQNNILIGYQDESPDNTTTDYDSLIPGLFYLGNDGQGGGYGINAPVNGTYYMPPADGWQMRSNNIFFGVRTIDNGYIGYPDPSDPALSWCPLSDNARMGPVFGANETCNTADPSFVDEPANPITAETQLDNYNFTPSSGSPAIAGGVAIAGITTDIHGMVRGNPPTIGAIEVAAGPPPAASQVTVTASPSYAQLGTSVTLTATVTSEGTNAPTGAVTFLNGSATLGTANLVSGVATLKSSVLAVGTYSVTASYAGDTDTQASVSTSAASLTVSTTPPSGSNVSLTFPGVSLNVSPNATGSIVVTVASVGGYFGTVNLTCATSSPEIGCSLTPPTVTVAAAGTPPTSTLSVSATQTASLQHPAVFGGSKSLSVALALLFPGSLLGLFGLRRRGYGKNLGRLSLLLLLSAGVIGAASLTGCSGTDKPIPQGRSYTVSVTANDGVATPVTSTINVFVK